MATVKQGIQIQEVAHHRNGIDGTPFHVVTFTDADAERTDAEAEAGERGEPRWMVAVVFEGKGQVAVFDRVLLGEGRIGFGDNSWRGDHYEATLRRAIRERER